jgi:hypothetical protein
LQPCGDACHVFVHPPAALEEFQRIQGSKHMTALNLIVESDQDLSRRTARGGLLCRCFHQKTSPQAQLL